MMPGPPERFLEVSYQGYSVWEISAALGNLEDEFCYEAQVTHG